MVHWETEKVQNESNRIQTRALRSEPSPREVMTNTNSKARQKDPARELLEFKGPVRTSNWESWGRGGCPASLEGQSDLCVSRWGRGQRTQTEEPEGTEKEGPEGFHFLSK